MVGGKRCQKPFSGSNPQGGWSACKNVSLDCLVYLVYLICLVYLVSLVCLVCFIGLNEPN